MVAHLVLIDRLKSLVLAGATVAISSFLQLLDPAGPRAVLGKAGPGAGM
jgi:hypothetical protein